MKPLATPVLGGMVSSLIHVLIVTPVIFFWLRSREVRREERATRQTAADGKTEAARDNELPAENRPEDHQLVR